MPFELSDLFDISNCAFHDGMVGCGIHSHVKNLQKFSIPKVLLHTFLVGASYRKCAVNI